MYILQEENFKLLLIFAAVYGVYRVIKWIYQVIIWIFSGFRSNKKPGKSKDWLSQAQERQEIRFRNASPPVQEKAKKRRKTWLERSREVRGLSSTGWKFNEETQLWEPPKRLK